MTLSCGLLSCQQPIEKCLRAVLALSGAAIPRTHNLEELGDRAAEAIPALAPEANYLAEITPYAVELRHDSNTHSTHSYVEPARIAASSSWLRTGDRDSCGDLSGCSSGVITGELVQAV